MTTESYRLDDLELSIGQRCLRRGGQNIELPRLSFELLKALMDAAPDSLSTDELMDRVWSGSVVSHATVAKRVELLREVMGDDSSHPRYIAVVRGHGYRLIPNVEALSAGDEEERPLSGRFAVGAAIALAAFVAIALYLSSDPPARIDRSIAVLPFLSISDAPEDHIFADGLTEELNHALAQLSGLKVIGHTSSSYYQDRSRDFRSVGDALGVAYVLEGSIRRSGHQLRVTAQLVSTDEGFQIIWSGSYDRRMTDVLDIQEDIARNVAENLSITLLDADLPVVATNESPNPEVYPLYLKAVSLSGWRSVATLARAQELIEQVVELDPGFASGWNRLAAIHGRRLFFRDPDYPYSREEGLAILHSAVEKALAIDPHSAEAHANLGGGAWVFEGDAAKGAPLIERALELDPSNLEIVQFAADFAASIGRVDEALELQQRLVDREPLCVSCRFQLAQYYTFSGKFDEADEHFRILQVMENGGFLWHIGLLQLLRHQPAAALASFEESGDQQFLVLQGHAMALHDLGRFAESAVALRALSTQWGGTQPIQVAQAYAYVGQPDLAFAWLERALPERTAELQIALPAPLFNSLHDDARWLPLLARINRAPHQTERISFSLPGLPLTRGGISPD